METKGIFRFEIIINVLVIYFRFMNTYVIGLGPLEVCLPLQRGDKL